MAQPQSVYNQRLMFIVQKQVSSSYYHSFIVIIVSTWRIRQMR